MEDEYGIADLRQMIAGRTSFPAMNHHQQSEVVQFNRSFPGATGVMPARLGHEHYAEMLMLGGGGMHHHQVGVLGVVDHHNQNLCGSGSGGGGMMEFCSAANDDSTTTTNSTTSNMTTINPNNTSGVCVLEMMEGNNVNGGGVNNGVAGGDNGGGNSRWPRQETLTLLEIRSSLDNKFKEANQKGPLWDEVARIMGAEHGYQRSGKKCREKFENLYKYYKKTKEGKSGRQDGKNYRFFRQLEALYGETTNNNHQLSGSNTNFDGETAGLSFQFMNNTSASTHSHQTNKFSDQSLSLSNSSDFDTSSSEDNNNDEDLTTFAFMDENGKNKNKIVKDLKRGTRKNWKAKIRDFVDARMKKLMETQEAWLDKVLKTLEHKEQERLTREEEWRRQETARLDQEHKFWAKERARFEARDAVIMEAVQRMVGNEVKVSSSPDQEVLITTRFHEATENQSHDKTQQAFKKLIHNRWLEDEISNLVHLRTGMESRFRQCGYSEKSLWEDISSKMVSLGYDRSAEMCEEKWLTVCSKYTTKTDIIGSNSTYKEYCTRNAVPIFHHFNSTRNHDHLGGGAFSEQGPETMGVVPSPPSNSTAGMTAPVQDSCFRFAMTQNDQGDNLWQNYGVKLNSEGGGNQTNRFISPLEEI